MFKMENVSSKFQIIKWGIAWKLQIAHMKKHIHNLLKSCMLGIIYGNHYSFTLVFLFHNCKTVFSTEKQTLHSIL